MVHLLRLYRSDHRRRDGSAGWRSVSSGTGTSARSKRGRFCFLLLLPDVATVEFSVRVTVCFRVPKERLGNGDVPMEELRNSARHGCPTTTATGPFADSNLFLQKQRSRKSCTQTHEGMRCRSCAAGKTTTASCQHRIHNIIDGDETSAIAALTPVTEIGDIMTAVLSSATQMKVRAK